MNHASGWHPAMNTLLIVILRPRTSWCERSQDELLPGAQRSTGVPTPLLHGAPGSGVWRPRS